MSAIVKKFNPLEMEESTILALATGREKLLSIMLDEMKTCLKQGSNQHFILYGPRGIGKSFFTRLLKIHHNKLDVFKGSLYLQLPEEQENINYAADLLDVISTMLEGGRLVDTLPRWSITDMQWENAVKRLNAAMLVQKKNGITHIFVTQENMQVFIPKLDKLESSRLREFLASFQNISIIGSSLRPDLDNDYSKRLFQVFKKLNLEPWTSDDFLSYYEKLASQSVNEHAQLETIKKTRNKIKAISSFTGGSPRLAVLLSKLILEKNILETVQLLDGLIDELTSYYQDITSDIPQRSKILFDMLIRKGENMTQSMLAAAFEPALEQSTIARSFGWLLDNYYVVFSKQKKGNTKYFYVRDRLYVLYYQKRMIYADVPFSFVGVFVDFLTEYYSQKERLTELKSLNLDHSYAHPLLYHLAKKENIEIDEKDDVITLKDNLLIKYVESIKNKKGVNNLDLAVKFFKNGTNYFYKADYDSAIIEFQKALETNPNIYQAYSFIGLSFYHKGMFSECLYTFQNAFKLEQNDPELYGLLGLSYAKVGEISEASKILLLGLTKFPTSDVIIKTAISIFIKNNYWENIDLYIDLWQGEPSIDTLILGALLYVIENNPTKRFSYFKNTYFAIGKIKSIDRIKAFFSICFGLYKSGDLDFLRQVVDELEHDVKDDEFDTLLIQAMKYLSNPADFDVNAMHPDLRIAVNAIENNK